MIKTRILFLTALTTEFALTASAAPLSFPGQPVEPSIEQLSDSSEFISWEDLKPGQKGYGLTVFRGDQPEKFEVEFAGVTNLSSKVKLILVKMGRPVENSEVLAGMSGSPVYFEREGKWKLAGALGYGVGNFSSDKFLGGITPIRAMLDQEKALGLAPTNPDLYPLQPKIKIASNASPETKNLRSAKPIRPRPGEAITVLTAEGDFRYGVTGTVTYVKGNKFYAFGHPFLGIGRITLPAYKSLIAVSFKSQSSAFKIEDREENYVGYVSFDSAFGIEGEIQLFPENAALPVNFSVSIEGATGSKKAEFHFSVFKDRIFSPTLIQSAAEELLGNLWNVENKATVVSNYTIGFEDRGPIEFFNAYSSGQITQFGPFLDITTPWQTIDRAADNVAKLLRSEWDFKIKNVQININLRPGDQVLVLDAFKVMDDKNKPVAKVKLGQTVNLALGLRNVDGLSQFIAYLPLQIPKNLKLGDSDDDKEAREINIYIESGNNFLERDENKTLSHRPDNQEEFLRKLLADERDPQKIYVQIVFPETETEQKNSPPLIISGASWQRVPNLNMLRSTKFSERKVVLKELDSPLNGYVLNIRTNFQLKLTK